MPTTSQLAHIEAVLSKHERRRKRGLERASHYAKALITTKAIQLHELREQSKNLLASAGLTGALLFSPSNLEKLHLPAIPASISITHSQSLESSLKKSLSTIVPHYPTELDENQAKQIESAVKVSTGIEAKAILEGQKLNHQVGYVGYEQHLQRFPGDYLGLHDDEQVAGIAPGLGAWGYFTKSKSAFTTQDYLREKYYSVAQTLYLPNWNSDFVKLRDWYKYRKILIVNPLNGRAVVTVLGDSGPAKWTGKQFGASPEAMKALDLHLGPRKGLVVFLFVDDPNDQIPLGPVTSNLSSIHAIK